MNLNVAYLCSALVLGACFTSADKPERNAEIPMEPELRDHCVDVLRRALNGAADEPENFWPAMHAAEGLTLAGHGGEVVTLLKARLPHETDHQRRCGLVREIVRAGSRDPLPILFATLADESSNGRVHAAESLYKIAEQGDRKLLQSAMTQTDNPRLQLMAAAALARAGDSGAVKRLRDSLSSQDREIRKIGAWTLGLLGGPDDILALKPILRDETDALARAYIVNALACLGDADARKRLGENLLSADPAVRTYSAEFAGYSRSVEFRPQLIKMLGDDHVDVRVRAAQSVIAFSLARRALGLPVKFLHED